MLDFSFHSAVLFLNGFVLKRTVKQALFRFGVALISKPTSGHFVWYPLREKFKGKVCFLLVCNCGAGFMQKENFSCVGELFSNPCACYKDRSNGNFFEMIG